ncbi:MAG: SpoIID/LytB domain-containing protein [Deltaproteobacteria bacterium]|nr:SpoIID/LytB domain-containing protein [Deltaproteobacteria bacterium]
MQRRIITLVLIILMSVFAQNAFAGYNNPILKVLLFKTSSPVTLSDINGLRAEGMTLNKWQARKITISPLNSNSIKIDNQIRHRGSLMISSGGYIQVQKKGSKSKKRYLGDIEVKPYKNGLYIINHIPTELYLEGVLNAEISTKWNMEVVKAQSVIARTFALFKRQQRKNNPWHLTSDHSDQVYYGVDISDSRGKFAINATQGMVVDYRGKLAQTFYHSNCGGMTEDPGNLWQYSLPYLKIKEVPFGKNDPRYYWETSLSDAEIRKILRKNGIYTNNIQNIVINEKTSSNRAYELLFTGKTNYTLLASNFRKAAGYRKFQSLMFEVVKIPGGYHFRGQGHGHGVGLCQWAAKEMAEEGYKFDEILRFFYSPINIRRYKG